MDSGDSTASRAGKDSGAGLSPADRTALVSAGTQMIRSLEACAAALDRLGEEARKQHAGGATVEQIAEALEVSVEFATALVSTDRRPTVRLQLP
ncbi:hypothetical protein [Raineyella fluvialis]|uniref:Uncharacterized protein n=1 Tax=Raineyella fluvialis TaxID=2662261 RepID=A0A5Q2F6V3_9ACTN|nr:hypothetical protein [Raineyella fluvialis]QGF22549.1 hypothetical protein Rai3103_01340 [Raineyella fluvialis]